MYFIIVKNSKFGTRTDNLKMLFICDQKDDANVVEDKSLVVSQVVLQTNHILNFISSNDVMNNTK